MVRETLRGLLRLWKVIVLFMLASTALGFVAVHETQASYRIDTVLIAQEMGADGPSARMDMDIRALAQLANGPAVTEAVRRTSGFPGTALELTRHIAVGAPSGSGLLAVQVRYSDVEMTKKLAQAYSTELLQVASSLKSQNPNFTAVAKANIEQPVQAANSPRATLTVIRYLASGFVAGIAASLVITYLRNAVRTPAQLRGAYQVPISAAETANPSGHVQAMSHVVAQVVASAAGDTRADRAPLVAVAALDKRARFDSGGPAGPMALVADLASGLSAGGYRLQILDTRSTTPEQAFASMPDGVTSTRADADNPLHDWTPQPGTATIVIADDPRRSAAAAQVTAASGALVLQTRLRADGMRDLREAITMGCTRIDSLAGIHLAPETGTA